MAKGKRRLIHGGGWRQTLPLVPLALFASAFTIQAASDDPAVATADVDSPAMTVPGHVVVPSDPLPVPANLPVPGTVGNAVAPGAQPDHVVSGLSRNGIPRAALRAYSRAQQVMAKVDPRCHLPWTLVAAIGRVESNHGRHGGNVLNPDGVAVPGVFGPRLDGAATARIGDTDDGALDGDTTFDRAVGPMQFIPRTWRLVGVDGDGDGARNPQDIDDAALSSAVYLCAGDTDLSDRSDLSRAILRYNHSQSYADLVLRIAEAYARGAWIAVDDGRPEDPDQGIDHPDSSRAIVVPPARGPGGSQPAATPAPGGGSPSGSSGSGSTGPPSGPTGPATTDPLPTPKPTQTMPVPAPIPALPGGTTVSELTMATQYCQERLAQARTTPSQAQLQECFDAYLTGGARAADAVIRDLLALLGSLGVLGGGLGG